MSTQTSEPSDGPWGPANPKDGPLWRVKVLDLSHVRAGPTCVRQLVDWGARAIKVEQPGASDDLASSNRHDFDFQNLHRNKRSLSLNLKDPEGLAIFMQLAKDADVVVENFRPAVKTRLGIDYDTLRAINPRIIYASLSGFGDSGPYKDRAGVDQIVQGMGGLMSITGLPGQGPVRVGIPVADLAGGNFLAQGVLLALYEREFSGEGQWVKTSLLQAMIQMLDFQATRWLIGGEIPPQAGNDHPTGVPTSVYETKDGHINIAASGNRLFGRLCEALGKAEWKSDAAFATPDARRDNRDRLNAAIAAVVRNRTSDEWVRYLNAQGVPAGPIFSIDQVFADPHVQGLRQVQTVHHKLLDELQVVGQAVLLSRTPATMRMAAPEAGEHSEDVLRSLGYTQAQIDELRKRKVI